MPNGVFAHTFGSLANCISYQGPLVDIVKSNNVKMWDEIGWDPESGRFGSDDRPYVLAIDLDAFTTSEDMPRVAWPTKWFEDEFTTLHRTDHRVLSVADVLSQAASGASLTLIAREPDYCGGEVEVARILRVLDDHVFEGRLKI